MRLLEMIVASTPSGVIGSDGKLPWPHSKDDMMFFIEKTRGKSLIMGRKTLESLPQGLKGRNHLVLTGMKNYSAPERFKDEKVLTFNSIFTLMSRVRKVPENEFILIGGGELYSAMFEYVKTVYWSIFKNEYSGDTFLDKRIMHELGTCWKHTPIDSSSDLVSFHKFERE